MADLLPCASLGRLLCSQATEHRTAAFATCIVCADGSATAAATITTTTGQAAPSCLASQAARSSWRFTGSASAASQLQMRAARRHPI